MPARKRKAAAKRGKAKKGMGKGKAAAKKATEDGAIVVDAEAEEDKVKDEEAEGEQMEEVEEKGDQGKGEMEEAEHKETEVTATPTTTETEEPQKEEQAEAIEHEEERPPSRRRSLRNLKQRQKPTSTVVHRSKAAGTGTDADGEMAAKMVASALSTLNNESDEDGDDTRAEETDEPDEWKYDLKEQLNATKYDIAGIVHKMSPQGFTVDYIKRTGLSKPLHFDAPPAQLGMKMPKPQRMSVKEVVKEVGGQRQIEVVEVKTQGNVRMTLQRFGNYYKQARAKRTKLWNVLSLEFSLTPLEQRVSAPEVIRSIDWVELYWPKELRKRQELLADPHNDVNFYPKVQNYCLMSVSDCFTDFHVDFGGTSVWYHVLKGEKIFFMIEPTEQNLVLYEQWTCAPDGQNYAFFGDVVERCARVRLTAGSTFVIPSGWIHAVYTSADSLVFGGNFLHSYAIPMQLRVYQSENKIRVGKKYRYPQFVQMQWYVVERVVRRATKRQYLDEISAELPAAYKCFAKGAPAAMEDEEKAKKEEAEEMSPAAESPAVLLPNASAAAAAAIEHRPLTAPHQSSSGTDAVAADAVSTALPTVAAPLTTTMEKTAADDESTGKADDMVKEEKDEEKPPPPPFQPATEFDDGYLRRMCQFERDGLLTLMNYLGRLHANKRETGEGIRDPDHLLKDFQAVLSRACQLAEQPLSSSLGAVDDQPSSSSFIDDLLPQTAPSTAAAAAAHPPKKVSTKELLMAKMRRHSGDSKKQRRKSDQLPHNAHHKTTTTEAKTPTSAGLPSASASKPPFGFDPMTQLVALGHKPLPTAFRQGPNMARVPAALRMPPARAPLAKTPSVDSSSPSSTTTPPSTSTSASSSSQLPPLNCSTLTPTTSAMTGIRPAPLSSASSSGGGRPVDPRRASIHHQQSPLQAHQQPTTLLASVAVPPVTTTAPVSFADLMLVAEANRPHPPPSTASSRVSGFAPRPVPPPPPSTTADPAAVPVVSALPRFLHRPPPPPTAATYESTAFAAALDPRFSAPPSRFFAASTTGPAAHHHQGHGRPALLPPPPMLLPPTLQPPPPPGRIPKRPSQCEQFPMPAPKLLSEIPRLGAPAVDPAAAAGNSATDIAGINSSSPAGHPLAKKKRQEQQKAVEEPKLDGQSTIQELDELTRELKNEPVKEAMLPALAAKDEALKEDPAAVEGGDPMDWLAELSEVTSVLTGNG